MKSIWEVKSLENVVQERMEGLMDGGGDAKNPNEKCVLSQFTAVAAFQCGPQIIFRPRVENVRLLVNKRGKVTECEDAGESGCILGNMLSICFANGSMKILITLILCIADGSLA